MRSCWRGGIRYILVRTVVRSVMLGEALALRVPIIVRVFLQMYMVCLEKSCVLMIEESLFVYLLVLLEVLRTLLVGSDVGLVD